MKNLFLSISTLFFIFTPVLSYAHGEDQPGPQGGVIRMPGAFHTEVIPTKNGFKVLLLDINFKNPSVKDAALKASIIPAAASHQAIELTCKVESDYFVCLAPKDVMKVSGTLSLSPTRQKAEGMTVSYPWPLPKNKPYLISN